MTAAMRVGGLEKYLLILGSELKAQGCEVTVVTTEEAGEWFPRVAEAGLQSLNLPAKSYRYGIFHLLRLARALRQFDVLLINHSREAQLVLDFLPDRITAIPVLHNDNDEIYDVGCLHASEWNVAVAVSNKVAQGMRQRLPEKSCLCIPNGVNVPADEQLAQRRPYSQPLRLLFVGRLAHAHKGIFFLPEILARCLRQGIDCRLEIVGDGFDREALLQQLTERALTAQVTYHPSLPPDQVYARYLDSHLLLLPSFYEGLPLVLLEASLCGCVPITSRLDGITDMVVDDGRNGFLTGIGDVEAIVAAVAQLAASETRWQEMSQRARATCLQSFTREQMGAAYLRLIDACLHGEYRLPRARRGWHAWGRKTFLRQTYR